MMVNTVFKKNVESTFKYALIKFISIYMYVREVGVNIGWVVDMWWVLTVYSRVTLLALSIS